MAEKNTDATAVDTAVEAEVQTKPKGKQIAATFTEDELAWIREALFVKRQLKPTELVRAAVFEYIKDVPKP